MTCNECIHKSVCYRLGNISLTDNYANKCGDFKQEPCEDAISREDEKHIDGFKYWCETNEENGTITIPKFVCDEIVKILDKLPSVQPCRKGHWIWKVFSHECSSCGGYTCFEDSKPPKFCPNCGADMRTSEVDK